MGEAAEYGQQPEPQLYKAMNAVVAEAMRSDKGYYVAQSREMAITSLLRLFQCGSQSKNQQQAQKDLLNQRYRNLSETARRDLRKKRQQAGSWSIEN